MQRASGYHVLIDMRWFSLPLLFIAAYAFANDSRVVGAGGSVSPLTEDTSIRMVEETIRLIPAKGWTRVDFTFRNDSSKPVTVQMGYPEIGGGDIAGKDYWTNHVGFKRFRTWVDGRRVRAVRTPGSRPPEGGYRFYWVKTVKFGPRQTRKVRVETLSPLSEVSDGSRFLGYTLRTGANWKGKIGKAKVIIDLRGIADQVTFTYPNWIRRNGDRAYIEYRDFEPTWDNDVSVHWNPKKAPAPRRPAKSSHRS